MDTLVPGEDELKEELQLQLEEKRIADLATFVSEYPVLYKTSVKILMSKGVPHLDAEDISQDLFANIYKRIDASGLQIEESLGGYVALSSYRAASAFHRSGKHKYFVPLEEALKLTDHEEEPCRELINRALDILSKEHRLIWDLHQFGFSTEDIAYLLDLETEGAARGKLFRIRKKLREELKRLLGRK